MKQTVYFTFLLGVFLLVIGCSAKKNSFKNRAYHNMTSWFNTLFNGQEAMDDKLKQIENAHQDNYFEILPVDPYPAFDANTDYEEISFEEQKEKGFFNKVASGNLLNNGAASDRTGFEKAEEKALKAISNHSMDIGGEERNKLISRAYLMLGQARYYQGKAFPALDALQYVESLPFEKHKAEAQYFKALANIQAGNTFDAEEILTELYEDEEVKKDLQGKVDKQYAAMFIEKGNYLEAIEALEKAIKVVPRNQKARLYFIMGQLHSRLGEYDLAAQNFQKVFKLKPGFEMEARSQVAIAQNYSPALHSYDAYKERMEKMAKTGTYEKYRNEFFYAIGEMSYKRDSLDEAELYLKKASAEPMSDPRYRGETFVKLAEVKFNKSDYVYANAYYDSAASIYPDSKRKIELQELSANFKKVMEKHYLVLRNDSILRLTAMSEQEKETYFADYIAALKAEDEAKRQEEEEQATVFRTESKIESFANSFDSEDKGKFYFYSNSAKSFGESEFKRIWGDIRLQDNWRVSTASNNIEDQKAELTGAPDASDPRRYDLTYYIEKIPTQKIQIDSIKIERDTTELSLGWDYFDRFSDVRLATKTLEHLLSTPPKEEDVKIKAMYQLFQMNQEVSPQLANRYKDMLLREYPNTLYAKYIQNPNAKSLNQSSQEAMDLYTQAFDAYQNKNYPAVLGLAKKGKTEFIQERIAPKFALLEARAIGATQGKEAYISALEQVMVLFQESEEASYAKKLMNELKNLQNNPDSKNNKKETPKKDPAQPADDENVRYFN